MQCPICKRFIEGQILTNQSHVKEMMRVILESEAAEEATDGKTEKAHEENAQETKADVQKAAGASRDRAQETGYLMFGEESRKRKLQADDVDV